MWSLQRPIALSERVPVLENMGFRVVDERTYLIARDAKTNHERRNSREAWFHDMLLERADGHEIDLRSSTHWKRPSWW